MPLSAAAPSCIGVQQSPLRAVPLRCSVLAGSASSPSHWRSRRTRTRCFRRPDPGQCLPPLLLASGPPPQKMHLPWPGPAAARPCGCQLLCHNCSCLGCSPRLVAVTSKCHFSMAHRSGRSCARHSSCCALATCSLSRLEAPCPSAPFGPAPGASALLSASLCVPTSGACIEKKKLLRSRCHSAALHCLPSARCVSTKRGARASIGQILRPNTDAWPGSTRPRDGSFEPSHHAPVSSVERPAPAGSDGP